MRPLDDFFACLGFFSRLPVPARAAVRPLAEATAMIPLAGAAIGCGPALVLLAASALGVPPILAGAFAVASLVATTGALHEDGLGDCADGFGGGATRERKLAIMRDSRIGTFAACAIALSLLIRVEALAHLAAHSPARAAGALIASAALSRAFCLWPLALLPPARGDGLGAGAGRPRAGDLALAFLIACAIGAALAGRAILPAAAFAGVAALAVTGLAWRQIGGQTGDVAGAVQQVAEIACLTLFASAL